MSDALRGLAYFQRKGFARFAQASMYRRSFRARSAVDVKMPRDGTSRWTFENQSST
ncbi:MAG: hypothetical protein OXG72_19110 [Acidobacteria bacterium]|nr:hypothetical protein [Acidobacteriota bacterium]